MKKVSCKMDRYNFKITESKWQKRWADNELYKSEINRSQPKYYVLEMFPYPSGRIHMGHVRNYTMGDVVARYMKANGYNILHNTASSVAALDILNTYSDIKHVDICVKK